MTTVKHGQRQRTKKRKGTTRRALGMSALAALALGLPTVSASAQSAGTTTTTAASTTTAATTTTASPTTTTASPSTTSSPSTTIAPAAASAQANADAAARDIRDLPLEIRSLDGSGNNQRHSGWGAAGTIYLRRRFGELRRRSRSDGARTQRSLHQQPDLQRLRSERLLAPRRDAMGLDVGPVPRPHVRAQAGRG